LRKADGQAVARNEILAAMPSDFDNYFEPLIDGGSIFFSLLSNKADLTHPNAWLIQT